jgi:hypothetical protein
MSQHKGVDYTVNKSNVPGVWKWRFQIGDMIATGHTKTNLELLAARRAQLRINTALYRIARERL